MARRTARRGGGDRVLESRHLIVLFLGVVLLCAVFFNLGYVMGKSRYSGLVHAAYTERSVAQPAVTELKEKSEPRQDAAPASTPGEWDFYSNKNNNRLEPATKSAAPPAPSASVTDNSAAASPPAPASPVERRLARLAPQPAHLAPPRMTNGAIVLQVAAVTQQGDAFSIAEALQRKKFTSFVVPSAADHLYRVQVGPFSDERAAENAKAALDHAGFKAIIKR